MHSSSGRRHRGADEGVGRRDLVWAEHAGGAGVQLAEVPHAVDVTADKVWVFALKGNQRPNAPLPDQSRKPDAKRSAKASILCRMSKRVPMEHGSKPMQYAGPQGPWSSLRDSAMRTARRAGPGSPSPHLSLGGGDLGHRPALVQRASARNPTQSNVP